MIKTANELATACKNVATNYKTLYVMGCIGAPMNESNKKRYTANYDYNTKAERKAKIEAATADTFGFDCVCLIKSLLWGWSGDASKTYGGAKYASCGVPDIGTEQLIDVCSDVSADFSNVEMGELLWMKGHVGVYIGGGLAVECTPSWDDGVQITAVYNMGKRSGYNGRTWKKHGKLPYVTYDTEADVPTDPNHTREEAEVEEDKPTAPNPARNDYQLILPMLRKGDDGDTVRALQILLKANGYDLGTYGPKGDGVDGEFGSATARAVRALQVARDLEIDEIAGPQVMGALMGVRT